MTCSPLLTLLSALLGLHWRSSGDLAGEVVFGSMVARVLIIHDQQGACMWLLPPLGIALVSLPLVSIPSKVTNVRSLRLPKVVPPIALHGPPTYCAPVLEPGDAPARTSALFDPPLRESCQRFSPATRI